MPNEKALTHRLIKAPATADLEQVAARAATADVSPSPQG